MGGGLFAALHCPRLPPIVYYRVKVNLVAKLKSFFAEVSVPHEAPEKLDHGDIDILLHTPLTVPRDHLFSEAHISAIREVLGAVRHEKRGPGQRSLAIPIPELDAVTDEGQIQEAYVQVDLTHCSSSSTLRWLMLVQSYGDVFQAIGVSLRPLGLAFLPECFIARIPQSTFSERPEDAASGGYGHNKRDRELNLSSDPDAVLEFLGLDVGKWHDGFSTQDEVFRWIVRGRFFDRRTFERAEEEVGDKDYNKNVLSQELWSSKQRNREKRRKRLRPMYRHFIEDWLPSNPEAGKKRELQGVDDLHELRSWVLEEALNNFGKQLEYDEMVDRLKAREKEDTFWVEVRRRLPLQGDSLGVTMRGLRRWVHFDYEEVEWMTEVDPATRERTEVEVVLHPPTIREQPVMNKESQPMWTKNSGLCREELLYWVDDNWEQIKSLEREREKTDKGAKKTVKKA